MFYCLRIAVDLVERGLRQGGDAIVQMFQISQTRARNAYLAALMKPGLEGSGFTPSLDPTPVLRHLVETHFEKMSQNVQLVRTHLTGSCRLSFLYKSHDLANLRQHVCVLGPKAFIQIKTKRAEIL